MILIGGVKPNHTVLATATLNCGHCHSPAAHRLIKDVGKLTLFFIPTVTVTTRYRVECVFCGAQNPMTKDEATTLHNHIKARGAAPGTVLGTVKPARKGIVSNPAHETD